MTPTDAWSALEDLLGTDPMFQPPSLEPIVALAVTFWGGPKDGAEMVLPSGHVPYFDVAEVQPQTFIGFEKMVTEQTGLTEGPMFRHLVAEAEKAPISPDLIRHRYALRRDMSKPVEGGVAPYIAQYEGLS